MAEVTLTDEQQKALVEETKKQLIASAKSVQDFEKITELPESGSVTLPVVQPDGSTKTFDAGNWLKDRETAYKATQSATNAANAATDAANAAAESANNAATAATNAANAANASRKNMESDVASLLAAQGDSAYFAGLRVAGTAGTTFTKEYGSREALLETLSHLRIGTIKKGQVSHYFAPGRCDLATNGDEVAIDGTDGDVCLITDIDLYDDCNRQTIGDTTYNTLGLGLIPHLIGSKQARKMKPFFMAADYCVNAKLDGDVRSQAHCIYNTSVAGNYSQPAAFYKQTLKPNGNGYPNQYISSLQASQQARNKNDDNTTSSPYQGLFHRWYELWWEAMYLELGTLDMCDPANFGYGCTNTAANASNFADTAMSGISGVKMITSDGNATYGGLMSQSLRFNADGGNTYNLDTIVGNGHYVFLEELIHLRIFNNITKNNLTGYVGNSSAVFTDLGARVITDGSVNLSTGAGMTAGQYYMQVRNVPNCQGIAEGVMTGVINIYVMVEPNDNVYLSDGKTSLKGGKVIFKFSLPVYRGMAFFKGMFTQLEGMYYRHTNTDGTRRMECWVTDNPEDIRFIGTSTGYCDGAEVNGILKGLILRFTTDKSSGWIQDTDYSVSMFAHKTTGGGQHSYENAFIWKDASWGYGDGHPAQGKSCVNAAVGGCSAFYASAGRALVAFNSASIGNGAFGFGFAGFVQGKAS